ncbi:MMPL family transporter [Gordonia sp. (in: high G+C Gram-positive bacteria)]|uniref:MMPL family transporter n=1 Tax=Gordonia sp. (in: high G+C Gram-positive bacteria) TaxID=84139 RepID=UPI0039E58FCC
MSTYLFRLGRFSFRNKWWVIGAWVALIAILGGLLGVLQPKFSKDFDLPGTDGGVAMAQMQEYFPDLTKSQTEANTLIVVATDANKPDTLANHTDQINALVADLQKLPKVDPQTIANPVLIAQSSPQFASTVVGDNGRVGLISVHQALNLMDLKPADKEALTEVLAKHRGNGLQVQATLGVMQAQEQPGKAEMIGFAIAFVVMIVAFGAIVAAFIPLITGMVGVGLTMMLLMLSAKVMTVNQTATAIVTMLGIAVSIDYALFIVSRYRTERHRGGDPADAAGRAVGTAGSAVVFAGLTVVIAVAALMVIGIPLITQMGMGAAVAVAVAVLAALTLIPALLGATGKYAFTPKIPWIRHAEESATADTLGVKYGRAIVKRPIPFIVGGLAVLLLAAIPMSHMQLGMDTVSDDEVAAQSLLKRGFGEGTGSEIFVVVHADKGTVNAGADTAVAQIRKMGDYVVSPDAVRWVGNVKSPADPANTAIIQVTPISAASSDKTHELVEKIRSIKPQVAEKGAELHVGGQTAIMSDLTAKLDKALIPYLLVVVGLAFLIMIGVFRSLWVPLIGTLGFIFSVLATFGATVWFFQEGALGLIDHTKPILSFLPIFLIGVVFGLAMDYQVFLVTRMREEYIHGMSAKEAIVAGYRHGARVVTSAAIIMISVFSAFMLAPDTMAKMMGFSMAIAIFFDAFIIRMTVVPAAIALLGDRAWGLPKWLDKLVVNFDIEGEAVRNRGLDEAEPAKAVAEPAAKKATATKTATKKAPAKKAAATKSTATKTAAKKAPAKKTAAKKTTAKKTAAKKATPKDKGPEAVED